MAVIFSDWQWVVAAFAWGCALALVVCRTELLDRFGSFEHWLRGRLGRLAKVADVLAGLIVFGLISAPGALVAPFHPIAIAPLVFLCIVGMNATFWIFPPPDEREMQRRLIVTIIKEDDCLVSHRNEVLEDLIRSKLIDDADRQEIIKQVS